jgi:8-oxo-dGTP diphosphatase
LSEVGHIPNLTRRRMIVVAAVIERDGQILIGQRSKGDWNQMKWEFPGGKMEVAESPRQALQRELREELDIEAQIGEEITRYEFQYPGRPAIELIFFRVSAFEREPKNLAFNQIKWETASHFPQYEFLDGDVDFVRRLARGEWPAAPTTLPPSA